MELFNDVVIENVLQMTGIENTPVEHTDVKQYHKVCITQQIQQVWDQYTVNTGKYISHTSMENSSNCSHLVRNIRNGKCMEIEPLKTFLLN